MGKRCSGLVAALVVAAGTVAAAQDRGTTRISLTRDGAPAANVQVVLQPISGTRTTVGTTGAAGDLEFALSLVNKNTSHLQVLVYECRNGEYVLAFVEPGAEAPEENNCRKFVVGMVRMRRGQAVAVDLIRRTVQSTGGQSFLGTRTGKMVAAAGAATVGLVALSAGGDDSPAQTGFNPDGNYPVTNSVASDPGGHREFIGMEASTVLVVAVTGSTVRITCPPTSKWTLITGTYNNGQITGEGRGSAAGRSNVLYRFTGTIVTSGSSQGQLTGQLIVGAAGEFPGGQPTTFNVTGRRQ